MSSAASSSQRACEPLLMPLSEPTAVEMSNKTSQSSSAKKTAGAGDQPELLVMPGPAIRRAPGRDRPNAEGTTTTTPVQHRNTALPHHLPPRFLVNLSTPPFRRYDHVVQVMRPLLGHACQDLRHVFRQAIRAYTQSMQCPRAVARVLGWLLRGSAWLFMQTVYDDEETDELLGLASAMGVPMHLLVAFNVMLDLLLGGCTSGGMRTWNEPETGGISLADFEVDSDGADSDGADTDGGSQNSQTSQTPHTASTASTASAPTAVQSHPCRWSTRPGCSHSQCIADAVGRLAWTKSRMLHFCTLDLAAGGGGCAAGNAAALDALRKYTVELVYVRQVGTPEVARALSYVGYVGVLVGVRRGLSLSASFRAQQDRRRRVAFRVHQLAVFLGWRRSLASTLRKCLLTADPALDARPDALPGPAARSKGPLASEEDRGATDEQGADNRSAPAPPSPNAQQTEARPTEQAQAQTQTKMQTLPQSPAMKGVGQPKIKAPIVDYVLKTLPRTSSTSAYLSFCTPESVYVMEKDHSRAQIHTSDSVLVVASHDKQGKWVSHEMQPKADSASNREESHQKKDGSASSSSSKDKSRQPSHSKQGTVPSSNSSQASPKKDPVPPHKERQKDCSPSGKHCHKTLRQAIKGAPVGRRCRALQFWKDGVAGVREAQRSEQQRQAQIHRIDPLQPAWVECPCQLRPPPAIDFQPVGEDAVDTLTLTRLMADAEICRAETHHAAILDPAAGAMLWRRKFPGEDEKKLQQQAAATGQAALAESLKQLREGAVYSLADKRGKAAPP